MFRFKALLRKTRDFSWLYKRSRNASTCEKSELKVEAKVVSQAIILFCAVFHLLTFWHFYKVTIFKAGIGIGTKTLMQCVCLYLRTCVFFTTRQSETHCEQLVKKICLRNFSIGGGGEGQFWQVRDYILCIYSTLAGNWPIPSFHTDFLHHPTWAVELLQGGEKRNWKCCRYKIFIEFILIPILVNSLRMVKLIENWIESFYSHCSNSHVTHHVYVD